MLGKLDGDAEQFSSKICQTKLFMHVLWGKLRYVSSIDIVHACMLYGNNCDRYIPSFRQG